MSKIFFKKSQKLNENDYQCEGMISSTYRLGAGVAGVADPFYYFLKFLKKSEAWGGYNWNIPS
jgi:hypothetical protein